MRLAIIISSLLLGAQAIAFNTVYTPPVHHNVPDESTRNKNIPFTEVSTQVKHNYVGQVAHPLTGAAVVDYDNDGVYEIFYGGGFNQEDSLLSYKNESFHDVIGDTGLSSTTATYGATAIDMNDDGFTDLLIARNDGAYLYLNNGDGTFKSMRLPLSFDDEEVPVSISVADIDQDGDPDLYVSVFVSVPFFRSPVFNDPEHAKANYLLLNKGDLNFVDITSASGTAGMQNTFFSTFADLNDDGLQDLIVSQNTGRVEIFENNGDSTFAPIDFKSPLGFWMGIGIGDIDNDGDLDLLFSNAGNTIPAFAIRIAADLKKGQKLKQNWLLLQNEGHFKFRNVTKKYRLKGKGFAWGAIFEDLNLNGDLDLLIARNYVKFPSLIKKLRTSGQTVFRMTEYKGQPRFKPDNKWNLNNSHYGISPLIVDFSGDGKPDVLWLNIDGPLRAFVNNSDNDFMTFRIPDKVSYLGAKLELISENGRSYSREILAGQGLLTDNSPDITFGLGKESNVKFLKITFPNGEVKTISDLTLNTVNKINLN